jgi:hypothetical protein
LGSCPRGKVEIAGARNVVGTPRAPCPHGVGPGLGTPDRRGDREALLDKVLGFFHIPQRAIR